MNSDSEQHAVTEPIDDEAYYLARSRVLSALAIWLVDEREKCNPPSARWVALADVTAEIHRLEAQEIGSGEQPLSEARTGSGQEALRVEALD